MSIPGTLPFWLLCFGVVSLALLVWVVAARVFCKSPRSRLVATNAGLAVFSTAYSLVALELLMSVFLVQSNGFGITLAARRWGEKYWLPTINSYGYRDKEPVWSDHLMVLVGASFVAGGGIERLDDTLSGALRRKLGPTWTVAVVAKPGWQSEQQFEALSNYPKTPDVVIVSHTFNDIEGAATKLGVNKPELVYGPPAFLRPLVERSSLVNWMFWRFSNQGGIDKYLGYLNAAYESPSVFAAHMDDLSRFTAYAARTRAALYFAIWPMISDVSATKKMAHMVSEALVSRGANVVDLVPYLNSRPASELVVNSSDSHPNARVHAAVADLIFQRLLKDGIVGSQQSSNQRF